MLKYTKASVNMLIEDCKRIAKVVKYVSLVYTILFLSYQVISGFIAGDKLAVTIINAVLLCTFILSTISEYVLDKAEKKGAEKVVKNIYKWFKTAAKAVTLGFSVCEVAFGPVEPLQIILVTLMILLWIVSFAAQLIAQIVTARAEIILVAFKQDIDDIKRPFTAVSNTFKKLTGREVVKNEPDARKQKIIDKLNEKIRQDKIEDEDDDE